MRSLLVAVSMVVLLLVGCGKVSRDFRAAGNDVKNDLIKLRQDKIATESESEQRRDEIKKKLQVVTAATKSDREHDAEKVLVNLYVQISTLKAAEMLPPSESAAREIQRLQGKADECLTDYDVLVGDKNGDENGPCLQEAKKALQ